MIRATKKNFFTLLITIFIISLNGCAHSQTERTVTIAYNPDAYASAISQIMIEKHVLDKYIPNNTTIKYVEMSNASDIRDALASGTIDIATPALTAFISGYENNMPLRLISNYGNAQVCLYSKNDINNIIDFDSTDVIATKGLNTNPHIALLAYCKEHNLNVDKYNSMLSKIPEAETIGMLSTSSSDISGAVLSYPITKQADALPNCNLLIDFTDIIQEYNLGTVVCVNSTFYNQNKDIIDSFEKAHKYIVENWNEDMQENAQILSKQYNCSTEEAIKLMDTFPPTMEISGYDKLANLMYECNMLTQKPKTFKVVME